MNDVKFWILGIIGIITIVGIVFVTDSYEQIYLSYYGDIENDQVYSIMETGRLLEPIMPQKLWVKTYVIGYANSTNKWYVQYSFTWFWSPHHQQWTEWQLADPRSIMMEWDSIKMFAPKWLPEKAYPLHPNYYSGVLEL